MKSAAVALQCSGAGAPEVVQRFYHIFSVQCEVIYIFFIRFSNILILFSKNNFK